VQHDRDLFSIEHELGWQGGLIPIPVRMTVLRLGDGQLVLHSPVPISPSQERELAGLGSVRFIVVPRAHGRFAAHAARQFPHARLLAAPFASRRQRKLPLRGELADRPPVQWQGQVDSLFVRGFCLGEVVLLQRSSRTLLLTDLCFNIQRSSSRVARAFFRANGCWQRFGPSRMIRLLVSDRRAFRESLQRILAWDFERIVPSHGDVLERGGKDALREAWLSPRAG
jgi:hypothetical protein